LTPLNLVTSQQQIAPFFDRPVVRRRPIPMLAQHDLRKRGITPTPLRISAAECRSNGYLRGNETRVAGPREEMAKLRFELQERGER
jgi:hypothetical protein